MRRLAEGVKGESFRFENALKGDGVSLICEIKKASPSKGVIDEVFDYKSIARDYVSGGADCVSCLTEPTEFLGSDEIFKEVRSICPLPMIRKDFTVNAYQIYQAKVMGADAVLLICSALDEACLSDFFAVCEELGLSAMFECRDERQIETALKLNARIIGVNNRNLRDFSVDLRRAEALRSLVDDKRIFVAESGISSPQDVKNFARIKVNACLVGEYCMRAKDRAQAVRELKNVSR